jgi:hypothetical protein
MDALRAQRLESPDLGIDVVRLDVNVHAARVVDDLDEHLDVVLRSDELP